MHYSRGILTFTLLLLLRSDPSLAVVWRSQTHVARKARGESGDMAVPNLFWRNVGVVSTPPPLYLNFYRKLVMIAKPSVGKGGWHSQEFLIVVEESYSR